MLKIKLILIALCLCVVGLSQLYLKGFDDGNKSADGEAFDAYTTFAQKMKDDKHRHAKAKDVSIWSVVDGKQ